MLLQVKFKREGNACGIIGIGNVSKTSRWNQEPLVGVLRVFRYCKCCNYIGSGMEPVSAELLVPSKSIVFLEKVHDSKLSVCHKPRQELPPSFRKNDVDEAKINEPRRVLGSII
jgi:hypothetical protein